MDRADVELGAVAHADIDICHRELEMVLGTELEDRPPLSIIIHRELPRTTRVRRFVDFLERELRKMRPLIQGQVSAAARS